LHVNSSYVTAVANDYGYDVVFSRMLAACGRPGDVLVGLSTSGNSPNVVKAAEEAHRIGMTVVALTGADGGALRDVADVLLNVPAQETPRIQESHILLGHTICGLVEDEMFGAPA
jgi:D-sedoheptulose 7-phosphate isomerase